MPPGFARVDVVEVGPDNFAGKRFLVGFAPLPLSRANPGVDVQAVLVHRRELRGMVWKFARLNPE